LMSASVNLLLHHKVQKFSSGTGWSGKRAVKWLWWCGICLYVFKYHNSENITLFFVLC